MSRPHRIVIPREYSGADGSTKTQWIECGVAWPNRAGGYNCELYAIPAATQDQHGNVMTRFAIFPPRDDDRSQNSRQPETTNEEPLNDDIPF